MPSLVAFGRRWNISSDDFVFPELTEGFVRLLWVAFTTSVFLFHFPLRCTAKDITLHVLVLLFLNGITAALAFLTAGISARGAIMDARPRRHVTTLIYIRLPVFVIELIWTVFATVKTFESVGDDSTCHFSFIIKVTVILEWLLVLCLFLGVFIVFNPIHEDVINEEDSILARKIWTRRFKIFKIRQDALMRAAIDDLANLVASFFQDADVVLSDIAAGLLLVVHSPTNVYPPIQICSGPTSRPNWMTERNALHFLHFASSVYGWPTYLLHNCGIRSYYRLFRKLQCCGKLRCDQVMVVEDNCCFCNTASFVLSTEDHNIDLFFVSFRNRLYEVPFVVLSDHSSKSIVVTIRGSCSLSDLVTDLCLEDESFCDGFQSELLQPETVTVNSQGTRVHRGMLKSARYVLDSLRKHSVLEDMFVLNPTYNLVICGHSLGAGVASLLTMLLKSQYPNIRCFAYSPPGCVVSETGISEMQQYVMSVVGGDDVVCRISYQAMHRLRSKVDKELRICQKAKYEILLKGIFRIFWKTPWEDSEPLSGIVSVPDRSSLISETGSTSYGTTNNSSEEFSRPLSILQDRLQLYAPGTILYIADENDTTVAEWIDAKCLTDIKLSISAVRDHMPLYLTKMLKSVVGETP